MEKLVGLRNFCPIGTRCRLKKLGKKSKVNPWDHKIIRDCLHTVQQGQGAYLIFTACIVQLHCNNGAYSCPVKHLNKNSAKKNIRFSKINSFEGTGHLFKKNLRKCRYIPLICALSLAGFDTKLHLKLRQRCSLKCHDFTFQSRILQVKKGHLILLSVILFDVGKFPLQSHPVDRKVHSSEALRFSLAITTPPVIQRHETDRPADRQRKETKKNQRRNVGLIK